MCKTPRPGVVPGLIPRVGDGETFVFDDWPFVRATTRNFLHIPLNIGSVFTKTFERIQGAGAAPERTYLTLSSDLSAWRGEHLFLVTKDVPGAEMVTLSGTFLAKVFEGPYREAKSWCDEMAKYVGEQGKKLKTSYFFYTTCPKCAKHYGKKLCRRIGSRGGMIEAGGRVPRGGRYGNREAERGTAPDPVGFDPDATVVQPDDSFDQGQADSRSVCLRIELVEQSEDSFEVGLVDAHAIVSNVEDGALRIIAHTDFDSRMWLVSHVFHGVINQVLENLR